MQPCGRSPARLKKVTASMGKVREGSAGSGNMLDVSPQEQVGDTCNVPKGILVQYSLNVFFLHKKRIGKISLGCMLHTIKRSVQQS